MRVLKFRRGAYGQRPAAGAHEYAQLGVQLGRKHRIEELREDAFVVNLLRDDVFESVYAYEVVEVVGGDDQTARDHYTHVGILVVVVIFGQHAVHEGQTARLASDRTLAEAGEAYGVAVCRLVELCHHALSEHGAVVLEE